MPFTRAHSFREVASRLEPLQHRLQIMCDSLGYQIPAGDFSEIKDVRPATLLICKADIGFNIMLFNFIADGEEGKINENLFRAIVGVQDRTIPIWHMINKLGDYLRLSFVTMFQFRIENMLTNILAILDKEKATRGYLDKAKALFEILHLDDQDRKLETLRILQFIRNSLHNNGIHNNKRMRITIQDCNFSFEKGTQVRCASWAHIVIAIEATLLIIEKILNAPKVRDIPEPISTAYIEP